MRRWLVFIMAGAALAHLAGCKGVGTVCSQSGSTAECGTDFICTFTRSPGTFDPNVEPPLPLSVCLRKCDTSTDCGEGELCQVVYCSTQKSCQTGTLQDPPPNVCGEGTGGTGGAGGGAGTGGAGGARECNSEAWAYIQTLDPLSGFNRTNFVQLDTTTLPEDWDRYSISLDLTDPLLEGQTLQFGFSATASNFEPSGVFYDKVVIEFGEADTGGGGGGGGAGGAGGASGAGGAGGADLVTEYSEDFESLDQASPTALGEDPDPLWGPGWVVFGNAFDPEGVTFLYGYGPNPAPNNSGGFSGIALDEGGFDQGEQVLVIISDYNNSDQALGRRIEANTFRERTITAGDIGDAIIFNFDAKRGNINSVEEGCAPSAP